MKYILSSFGNLQFVAFWNIANRQKASLNDPLPSIMLYDVICNTGANTSIYKAICMYKQPPTQSSKMALPRRVIEEVMEDLCSGLVKIEEQTFIEVRKWAGFFHKMQQRFASKKNLSSPIGGGDLLVNFAFDQID